MRHTALAALVCLLGGCPSNRETALAEDGGDDLVPTAPSRCIEDVDCATAASTCCDCPEFAVDVEDPAYRACTGVACPDQGGCADNVRAACDDGTCVLACVAMACPSDCPVGYTIDPTGCLSCACAVPQAGGCMADTDCVQTRADCCGCDQGGAETAVLATEQAAYDAMLACPVTPACPAIDVCDPGAAPRCVQGRCDLSNLSGLPPAACGTADLPACPAGTVCTVNASEQANLQGVGVCVPA